MAKKLLKPAVGLSRRPVKRGAPPIVKPRRHAALSGKRPARAKVAAIEPAVPAPPLLPERALEPEIDEELIAAAGDLGEAAPEEVAELESSLEETMEPEAGTEGLAEGLEGEPEAEEERAPRRAESEEPSNFLAMYFAEMSELDVLRPEEEFRQAREIERLEIELWERIFAYPPIIEHVLKVVELTIENSLAEFRPLRKAVSDYRKEPSKKVEERLTKAARKAAEKLRAIDIDKRILDVVLPELDKIATGDPGRVVLDRLSFSPKSASFRRYHAEVKEAAARALRAKNEFVKANLRLVVSIARRFNHGRMPLADLIQEGNIGLIKAVERFDYRRGYRFSTYASWWIRHAISRALADKGRAVRLPVHMIDAYHRVAKSKRELAGRLGRQPTAEELGEATGIAPAKIEKMRSYLLDQSFSLDRPVSDEDGRRFIDFIQDPNQEQVSPVDTLANEAMTEEVRHLLQTLKPIEADILRQRFGLDDERELTLKEIGEKYNLSRERIRQLQEQALMKMRRALQRKDLM